jgi:excisionase family DNA binding protein
MDVSIKPIFVSVSDAALFLNIGRTKAYEMAASGELPATKFGRCVRVSVVGLETIAKECATKTTHGVQN